MQGGHSHAASGGDPAAANEEARLNLRALQIDENEAARPGGGQDEINAVEKADTTGKVGTASVHEAAGEGDPGVANEAAHTNLRALQIDENEAARPGGGQDEINAVEKADKSHSSEAASLGLREGPDTEAALARAHRAIPGNKKAGDPFPMRTSVRHKT